MTGLFDVSFTFLSSILDGGVVVWCALVERPCRGWEAIVYLRTETIVDGALEDGDCRHERVRCVLYIEVCRLKDMLESFRAHASLWNETSVSSCA